MSGINTEHGIFEENKKMGQTAEEVYQEWLENKYKPTQIELLKAQITASKDILDFHEELIVELAMQLY